MKKILYIHGYHGSSNGNSFNTLKKYLPEGYSIEGVDYNENDCTKAIKDIANYIADNDIDILIGSSLGGFLTMLFGGMPRIVINPCYSPSVELPKIGASDELVNTYKVWENKSFKIGNDLESKMCLIGCFGNNDELLGNQYVDSFKKNWGIGNNCVMINSGHHISDEGAQTVVSLLPELIERANMVNIFENNKGMQ